MKASPHLVVAVGDHDRSEHESKNEQGEGLEPIKGIQGLPPQKYLKG
jgi:hypothetical protein